MTDIKMLMPYKEFREEFNTKLVYTKRDMTEALEKQAKSFVVNRVIQKGKDFDIALKILAVHTTSEGTMVIVS